MAKHTCGGPKFGHLAPAGECPRCDELRAGAPARSWARKRSYNDNNFREELRRHAQTCKICLGIERGVCTFGEW